jgi:hypothetical protein
MSAEKKARIIERVRVSIPVGFAAAGALIEPAPLLARQRAARQSSPSSRSSSAAARSPR